MNLVNLLADLPPLKMMAEQSSFALLIAGTFICVAYKYLKRKPKSEKYRNIDSWKEE